MPWRYGCIAVLITAAIIRRSNSLEWSSRGYNNGRINTTRRAWLATTAATLLPRPSLASLTPPSDWTGTQLPWMGLEEAVAVAASASSSSSLSCWPMARWPDPILRRPANPVPNHLLGTPLLRTACRILLTTCETEGAVGLAAQQCGVDARMVHLVGTSSRGDGWIGKTLVNPIIVDRSPEIDLRVWDESCLVLPPDFRATVLRDAWVTVAYWSPRDTSQDASTSFDADATATTPASTTSMIQKPSILGPRRIRLVGEAARAVQHELDHDRGILITDHMEDVNDLPEYMREVEGGAGRTARVTQAWARTVG